MSQEKVDAYKESKANRKHDVEKARRARVRNKIIARAVGIAVGAALIAALAITGINMVKAYEAKQPVYDPTEYVLADYVGVTDEAEETEADVETAAEAEEAETEAETETEGEASGNAAASGDAEAETAAAD